MRTAFSLHVCLFLYFCLAMGASMPCLAANPASSPEGAGHVLVEVSSDTRFHVYKEIPVLPFVGENSAMAEALTAAFFRGLDRTEKYNLKLQAAPADWPDDVSGEHMPAVLRERTLSLGLKSGFRHVITGSLNTSAPSGQETAGACLFIAMYDTQTSMPVWSMELTPQPPTDAAGTVLEQFQVLLHQGTDELVLRLINRGDIFSPRLPAPQVLLSKGKERSVRVIIQPEPENIFSAYQLMRSGNPGGTFTTIGEPVAHGTSPLIIDDDNLDEHTTYYYTVIGISTSGLASIPSLPFAISTLPAQHDSADNGNDGLRLSKTPSSPHINRL